MVAPPGLEMMRHLRLSYLPQSLSNSLASYTCEHGACHLYVSAAGAGILMSCHGNASTRCNSWHPSRGSNPGSTDHEQSAHIVGLLPRRHLGDFLQARPAANAERRILLGLDSQLLETAASSCKCSRWHVLESDYFGRFNLAYSAIIKELNRYYHQRVASP